MAVIWMAIWSSSPSAGDERGGGEEGGELRSEAWGEFSVTPIFLEASRSLVAAFPLPALQTRWSFPIRMLSDIEDRLAEFGLPSETVSRITRAENRVTLDGYIHLFPTGGEVRALSREVRATLYGELAKHSPNTFHVDPALILSPTVEEWYRGSGLQPDAIALISRLSYRRGNLWVFSDVPLLLGTARGEAQARELYKALTRTRAQMVRLKISSDSDASIIREYWSLGNRGFRLKDLEPLIESLQETGMEHSLDLAHVLPPLPRKLLYTYPGIESASRGILPDCHWTSLNFFHSDPHDYLLDSELATSKVLSDYEAVDPPYAYGDIIFFIGSESGDAVHSCIYLAGGLVYTKNGRNILAPWIISSFEDVDSIYNNGGQHPAQAYRLRVMP